MNRVKLADVLSLTMLSDITDLTGCIEYPSGAEVISAIISQPLFSEEMVNSA